MEKACPQRNQDIKGQNQNHPNERRVQDLLDDAVQGHLETEGQDPGHQDIEGPDQGHQDVEGHLKVEGRDQGHRGGGGRDLPLKSLEHLPKSSFKLYAERVVVVVVLPPFVFESNISMFI